MSTEVNCDDYWQDGNGQWWVRAKPRPRPIPASQVPAECKTTSAKIVPEWAGAMAAISVGEAARTKIVKKKAAKKKVAHKAKAKGRTKTARKGRSRS